jgi:hypothetical protein
MRRFHLPHRRGLGRASGMRNLFVLVCLFGAGLAVWFVPLSSAHNSLVTVSLDCNGKASYTATAWAGPTSASRTNVDVRVFDSIDNGATWVQVGQGQFNQGNRYSFAGTFSIGSSKSVRVKVQEFAAWGDGARPAGPGTASANAPSNCTTTTTATATTTTAPTTTAPTTTARTTTTAPTTTAPATTTAPPPATTTAPSPATTTRAATPPVSRAGGGTPGAPVKKAATKVEKVTARAKPARPVVGRPSFTG